MYIVIKVRITSGNATKVAVLLVLISHQHAHLKGCVYSVSARKTLVCVYSGEHNFNIVRINSQAPRKAKESTLPNKQTVEIQCHKTQQH